MVAKLQLGDTTVEVVRRDVKRVNLSVNPPEGRVRISAPRHLAIDSLRLFAISKLAWIRTQQDRLRRQKREAPREFLDRESHQVWGRRHLLRLVVADAPPAVELTPRKLMITLRPGSPPERADEVLAAWYRRQVREAAEPLIARWQTELGVTVNGFYVRQMKTMWGSCNAGAGTIRLNTELAKKPRQCLEYIVVHEMLHLVEPTHGPRFVKLMERCLPLWKHTRSLLNRLPARHEHWAR